MKKINLIFILTLFALIIAVVCIYYFSREEVLKDTVTLFKESNFNKGNELLINKINKSDVSVLFVGDIMLGRNVELLMNNNGEYYPFSKIKDLFDNKDYVFGNLEGAISENHIRTKSGSFTLSLSSTTPKLLKDIGFAAVSLANNHTLDTGYRNFDFARKVLNESGIKYFGQTNGVSDPLIIDTRLGGIALFGFNMTFGNFPEEKGLKIVSDSKFNNPNVKIVIYPHWGEEYKSISSESQRIYARKLIDAGADIIVGSHPHVYQEIEIYKNKPIFYSLGNFIFDQYFSKETQEGFSISWHFDDRNDVFEIIPYKSVKSQPEIMTGAERVDFLNNLLLKSRLDKTFEFKDGLLLRIIE